MSYKPRAYCRKFSLVLSFALLCLAAKSQYNFAEVDKLLTANQKLLGNDIVAIIYKDGKIIYQKELGEEFKIKTRAPIASCSKWLTAALVMSFVDEGKLSLDDKVSKYLPIFETYGKSSITLRHCLSHQTGIEDNEKGIVKLIELQKRKFESLEEQVVFLAKKYADARPGSSFNYGYAGLNIAGRVLEVITNKKFDALAKQRLFAPLNMRNTSFTPEENSVNPSGGAASTAADYMNFLTMILDKGMFMGKRVLSESAITEMQTIQVKNIPKKFTPKVAEGFEYGLGEWITETDGKGNSTVVACPGLFGTWPYIDNCRKYACIFFIKNFLNDQKKELYLQLKNAVDKQILPACN